MQNTDTRKSTQALMQRKGLALFDLSSNCTLSDLKKRHKKLCLLYHPDKLTKANLSLEEQKICLRGGFMGAFVYIDNEYKKLVESHSFSPESSQPNQNQSTSKPATSTYHPTTSAPPQKKSSTPATSGINTSEFISIKNQLKRGVLNNVCFINEKALDRVVVEIIQGNFSLNDVQNWNHVLRRFWTNDHTWKLIDGQAFTIADAARFKNPFLEKISTLVISQLLLRRKLTLDEVNFINISHENLNNEHIDWIIKERPDLMSSILSLQNNAPFFKILNTSDFIYNKLDKVFRDFLTEILVGNKITFDDFSEFSALELMLIGMELYSYEKIREIPAHRRDYLKGLNLLSLVFPDVCKNTSHLLTETPNSLPIHYSFDFLLSLSDEHLFFISKNVLNIKKYNITFQHLFALSSQEMQEINTNFSVIDRDMQHDRPYHTDGKPSVHNPRYATIISNQILNRFENNKTSMESTLSFPSQTTNPNLFDDDDLEKLMKEFFNENQKLLSTSKNSEKISSNIGQTFFGEKNNEPKEMGNQESKHNTQTSDENTGENPNNQNCIIS